jgi:hypothetical protein
MMHWIAQLMPETKAANAEAALPSGTVRQAAMA